MVVRLDSPPDNLRPGLSTTAKIKTAEKKSVIAIPIQALAVRTRKDLEEAAKNAKGQGSSGVTLAAPPPAAAGDPKKDEIQGVFVVNGKKAFFRPVETGITGRYRHRSHQGFASRGRDRCRQLQSAANAEARGEREDR